MKTIGFGAPDRADAHCYLVRIPPHAAGREAIVTIAEDFGLPGADGSRDIVERCALSRGDWNTIQGALAREFNERLDARELPRSRWLPGTNHVERLLGKELVILAWAIEQGLDIGAPCRAIERWRKLTPEARWWLATMTCGATGSAEQRGIGWRAALRMAFTDPYPGETRMGGDE